MMDTLAEIAVKFIEHVAVHAGQRFLEDALAQVPWTKPVVLIVLLIVAVSASAVFCFYWARRFLLSRERGR
jgi:hypothetical protein